MFEMNDFFVYLLFGHIIGDYMLQPLWMALNKKDNLFIGFFHCFIYSSFVCCTTLIATKHPEEYEFVAVWFIIIFLFHAITDCTNLIDSYLHMIDGRSYPMLARENPILLRWG